MVDQRGHPGDLELRPAGLRLGLAGGGLAQLGDHAALGHQPDGQARGQGQPGGGCGHRVLGVGGPHRDQPSQRGLDRGGQRGGGAVVGEGDPGVGVPGDRSGARVGEAGEQLLVVLSRAALAGGPGDDVAVVPGQLQGGDAVGFVVFLFLVLLDVDGVGLRAVRGGAVIGQGFTGLISHLAGDLDAFCFEVGQDQGALGAVDGAADPFEGRIGLLQQVAQRDGPLVGVGVEQFEVGVGRQAVDVLLGEPLVVRAHQGAAGLRDRGGDRGFLRLRERVRP